MQIKSYAKINLTLDILGKRSDGYHEMDTILQQISLHDIISLENMESEIKIECDAKELENSSNLAFRAAEIMKEVFGISKGVKISISKKIPVGAGLSGGSSNAAAVMKGLNKLWNIELKEEKLAELGKSLGMDVPFHIYGGTCRGKERGDVIERLKPLEKYYLAIAYPGFGISTKEAYGSVVIGKNMSSEKFAKNYNIEFMHNDFEKSIFKKYPGLIDIKTILGQHSLLSGSGSCVFGLFSLKNEAISRLKLIEGKCKAYLAETI